MSTSVDRAASRTRAAGPVQAIVLLIGSTFPIMGLLLISPALPEIIANFHTTPGAAVLGPIALTIPALGIAVFGPILGPFIDRIGRLRVLYPALVVYAIFGTAPLWLNSLIAILVSRALLGIAEAAIMSTCLTLLGDYFQGRTRDRYLSMHAAAASIGAVIFLAVGGALGAIGWRVPFFAYLLPLVLLVVMLGLLWEPERAAQTLDGPRAALPWRALVAPLILTLFGAIVFYGMQVQLSIVLATFGAGAAQIGASAALANLGVVIGSVVFAGTVRRAGAGPLLAIGLGLAAIGLIPMGLGGGVGPVTIGAVIAGLGGGILLPALLIGTTSRLVFAQRGRGTSAWTSVFQFGQFASPIVVAIGMQIGGKLGPALVGLGVAGIVLAVVSLIVTRRQPLQTNEQLAAQRPAE